MSCSTQVREKKRADRAASDAADGFARNFSTTVANRSSETTPREEWEASNGVRRTSASRQPNLDTEAGQVETFHESVDNDGADSLEDIGADEAYAESESTGDQVALCVQQPQQLAEDDYAGVIGTSGVFGQCPDLTHAPTLHQAPLGPARQLSNLVCSMVFRRRLGDVRRRDLSAVPTGADESKRVD